MVKLGSLPKDWGDGRSERDLTKPFPLTEAWVWEGDERPYHELRPLLDAVCDHGSLVLGTDGCTMYSLIVTGPHHGHMWTCRGIAIDAIKATLTIGIAGAWSRRKTA